MQIEIAAKAETKTERRKPLRPLRLLHCTSKQIAAAVQQQFSVSFADAKCMRMTAPLVQLLLLPLPFLLPPAMPGSVPAAGLNTNASS